MFKSLAFGLCLGLATTSAFADSPVVHAPVVSSHTAVVADATSDRKQAERLSDATSDRKQAERLSDATSDRKQAERLSDATSDRKQAERLSATSPAAGQPEVAEVVTSHK
jgi:hypothetical protein